MIIKHLYGQKDNLNQVQEKNPTANMHTNRLSSTLSTAPADWQRITTWNTDRICIMSCLWNWVLEGGNAAYLIQVSITRHGISWMLQTVYLPIVSITCFRLQTANSTTLYARHKEQRLSTPQGRFCTLQRQSKPSHQSTTSHVILVNHCHKQ